MNQLKTKIIKQLFEKIQYSANPKIIPTLILVQNKGTWI